MAKAKLKHKSSPKRAPKPARAVPTQDASTDQRQKRRPLAIITRASDMQSRMMAARNRGLTIGFVPTMGALHSGHAALLDETRRRADIVVASVFVNPMQFNSSDDLHNYPRTLEADTQLANSCGVDLLFVPEVDEVYPRGFDTTVRAGALASALEGADRPGHFDGMLTVVLSLFNIIQPHFAVFGEKDYQQLLLVQRMVRDFRLAVEIVAMPVIRDVDGLALSSRNARLTGRDRKNATALYKALMAAQDEAQKGTIDVMGFVRAARTVLDKTPGVSTSYVEVRDPRSFLPVLTLEKDARVLIAATLGGVRLIDNGPLFAGVRYR